MKTKQIGEAAIFIIESTGLVLNSGEAAKELVQEFAVQLAYDEDEVDPETVLEDTVKEFKSLLRGLIPSMQQAKESKDLLRKAMKEDE